MSRTACTGSAFLPLTTCAAPTPFANSSLAESRSTPITLAPQAAATLIAASPIPPHPNTATHSRGFHEVDAGGQPNQVEIGEGHGDHAPESSRVGKPRERCIQAHVRLP